MPPVKRYGAQENLAATYRRTYRQPWQTTHRPPPVSSRPWRTIHHFCSRCKLLTFDGRTHLKQMELIR